MRIVKLSQDIKEPSINEKGEIKVIEEYAYIKLKDIFILEECQNILPLDADWATKEWHKYRKENRIDMTYHITIVRNGCFVKAKHCILSDEQIEQIKQYLNENG